MAAGQDTRLLSGTVAVSGSYRAHRVYRYVDVDRPGRRVDSDSLDEPSSPPLSAGRHECGAPSIPSPGAGPGAMQAGSVMMEAGPFSSQPARRFRLSLGCALLISLLLHDLLLVWMMFSGAADILLLPLGPAVAAPESSPSSLQFTFVDL